MFRKQNNDTQRGIEALQMIALAIKELNETLIRIESKVDTIYNVYQDLNITK